LYPDVGAGIARLRGPSWGDRCQVTSGVEAFENGGLLGRGPGDALRRLVPPVDVPRPPPDAPPGLPTGKALVEAVEKYLKQRKDAEDDDSPPLGPAV